MGPYITRLHSGRHTLYSYGVRFLYGRGTRLQDSAEEVLEGGERCSRAYLPDVRSEGEESLFLFRMGTGILPCG